MEDERSFLTVLRSGEACGFEQTEVWMERSSNKDDGLDCLMLQISSDSL